jgi:hypothetical protein
MKTWDDVHMGADAPRAQPTGAQRRLSAYVFLALAVPARIHATLERAAIGRISVAVIALLVPANESIATGWRADTDLIVLGPVLTAPARLHLTLAAAAIAIRIIAIVAALRTLPGFAITTGGCAHAGLAFAIPAKADDAVVEIAAFVCVYIEMIVVAPLVAPDVAIAAAGRAAGHRGPRASTAAPPNFDLAGGTTAVASTQVAIIAQFPWRHHAVTANGGTYGDRP